MGQVIAGRFDLLEPLAGGGQGTVWVARDLRRQQRCAAKVLRQSDSAALLRFVREQGVQVDHPHLASPYGWAAEDHEVAIAMPLVAGGSLEDALADHGALSEPLVAHLLLQILDSLSALHADGWVHRDVKPANVLLEPTGTGAPHARLGDMGLAMRVSDARLTQLGLLHGTPGFVAPEAAAGAHPAPAQDLFAAGRTALRLLAPAAVLDDATALTAVLAGIASPALRDLLGEGGLGSADPDLRARAAAGAPAVLAPLVAAGREAGGGFLTAEGEPFEVFDQVQDLMAGPGPAAAAPTSAVSVHKPATGPAAASGGRGGQGTRRWAWALIVLGLLAVATALALLLGGGRGNADGGLAESGAASPSSSVPTSPTPSGASTPAAPTAASSAEGPAGPATPSSTGSPRIISSVRLGDDCLAAEHGTEVRGVDGRHLMCTWGDGAYAWTEVVS